MVDKEYERDQLKEDARKPDPLPVRHPPGDPSAEKLLKRRFSAGQNQTQKAPNDKKAKHDDTMREAPNGKNVEHEDFNEKVNDPNATRAKQGHPSIAPQPSPAVNTDARSTSLTPSGMDQPKDGRRKGYLGTTTLPRLDAPAGTTKRSDGRIAGHAGGKAVSPVDAREQSLLQRSNRPRTQGVPGHVPLRPLPPTDDELYIFVHALNDCLLLDEQILNAQDRSVVTDYLLRQGVLARLGQREDYRTIAHSRALAPKLAIVLHCALESTLKYLYSALDEGKITHRDFRRWGGERFPPV